MSRDRVSANDSVSVGLERTPAKQHAAPRCPLCESPATLQANGEYECSSCKHHFKILN